MLDERRLKLMTKLAFYEETGGEQDFKISEYYRKDYVSFHTLGAIFWITLGYVSLLAIVGLIGFDSLMGKMSNGLVVILAIVIIAVYIFLVILYGVISNHIFNEKHKNARQRVKKYNHDLTRLIKMYEKEKK